MPDGMKNYKYTKSINIWPYCGIRYLEQGRGVIPGGAGGFMAPPDFGRSVNPISTRGDRFCRTN